MEPNSSTRIFWISDPVSALERAGSGNAVRIAPGVARGRAQAVASFTARFRSFEWDSLQWMPDRFLSLLCDLLADRAFVRAIPGEHGIRASGAVCGYFFGETPVKGAVRFRIMPHAVFPWR